MSWTNEICCGNQAVDMWTTLRKLRVAHIPTALLLLRFPFKAGRDRNVKGKEADASVGFSFDRTNGLRSDSYLT